MKDKKKLIRLFKPEITHISLVRKGANNKTAFIIKSGEDGVDTFQMDAVNTIIQSSVVKSFNGEPERHIIKCVAYSPNEPDLDGNYMTEEDIEYFAHNFMKSYRLIDREHNMKAGEATVVEGYVADINMNINEHYVKKGSFLVGLEVDEKVHGEYERGELTGVSIFGKALYVDEGFVEKSSEKNNDNNNDNSIDNTDLVDTYKHNNKIVEIFKSFFNDLNKTFTYGKNSQNNLKEVNEMNAEEMKNILEPMFKEMTETISKSFKENVANKDAEKKEEDAKEADVQKSAIIAENEKLKSEKEVLKSEKDSLETKNKELSEEIEKLKETVLKSAQNSDGDDKEYSPFHK